MRIDRAQGIPVVVWIVAALVLIQMGFVGNSRARAGLSPASTSTPATATSTTTPTATSTAGIVTPAPLGSWVNWHDGDWPTNALSLEDIELRGVYFPSADEGWAVGFGKRGLPGWDDVAIILHYQNGEWTADESLPLADRKDMRLHAIDGTGPDNIWAVGKDLRPLFFGDGDVAAIIHYDGERWTEYNIEPLQRAARAVLTDVDMVLGDDGIEGWAISERSADGQGGYVLHFVEGQWERQASLNGKILWTIDMVDATEGWIVSEDQRRGINFFYWYHNGRWADRSSWGGPMYGISMADPLYGLAVGELDHADEYYGECHTEPPISGCGWKQHPGIRVEGAQLQADFQAVQLLSRYDGWLVGTHRTNGSTVVHYARLTQEVSQATRDAINWQLMSVEDDPRKDMYGLFMLPGSEGWAVDGWAVGEGGAILHYEGPAQPATATPTPTATATSTGTATATASPIPTATISPTPTPSTTPTPSPTTQPTRQHLYLPFLARNRAAR
ncbi:MAG: hypothetical protein ACE5HA_05765 [Anaerolineae bacterium]